MQNPSLPEGPGADTCAQPDAVGIADGSASGPQVLSWEAGLKGWKPEKRHRHPGGFQNRESSHRVTGSWWGRGRGPRPGPEGLGHHPPSQGRLFPGVPPSRSETARESSFQGWKSLRFAAFGGDRGPPGGVRRRAGAHRLEGRAGRASLAPRPSVGGPHFPDIPPWRPHASLPLTLPWRVTQSPGTRRSCVTTV